MVKMLEKNLFVNGAEVFRIEIYPEEDIYYISDEIALIRTTKENFVNELSKYDWILQHQDKKLVTDYLDLLIWTSIKEEVD